MASGNNGTTFRVGTWVVFVILAALVLGVFTTLDAKVALKLDRERYLTDRFEDKAYQKRMEDKLDQLIIMRGKP